MTRRPCNRHRHDKNGRCTATKADGSGRCERPAAPGSDECLQHGGADAIRAALAARAPGDTDGDDNTNADTDAADD